MPKLYAIRYTQNAKSGFSLIEILLSLVFVAAIVTILLTTTGSLFTRRQSNLQSIASKIATKEIERLRELDFNLLPEDTSGGGPFPDDSACVTDWGGDTTDLNQLRRGCLKRIISDYDPPDTTIKQINITVKWENDNGGQREIEMDTLRYEHGL